MDSIQISCFIAVAQTCSFSRAAKLLYKSQPVVSRQIIALENDLGVKLFNRSARSVSLTDAGQIFYKRIEKISSDYENLLETMRSAQTGYLGEIRVYVHSGHVYASTLVPLVKGFEKKYPNIRVVLNSSHTRDVKRALEDMQADFVYARWHDYSQIKDAEGCIVSRLVLGALLPSNHPLASKTDGALSISDLKDETFITYPDNVVPGHSRRLERWCMDNGFEPNMIYAPDTNTALLWMEAKRGIALVNQEHIFTRYSEFSFVELPELGTEDGAIIWNKNNDNHSLDLFKAYVEKITI